VTTLRTRVSGWAGLLVAAAAVAAFFVVLRARDWYWPDFGVPGGTGLYFLDLRFFTSAWECVRDGRDVIPANPCDPQARVFNYPRVWLVPAPLGLDQEDTVRLGKLLVLAFFGSAFALIGRASVVDGLVWAAALVSPAVMLGVERGNPDLVIFCLVVWGVILLQRASVVARVGAHALLLLAAVLKLYPVLGWGPLLRQPRRWAIAGVGALAGVFGVYALIERDDLRRIRETVPREEAFAHGAAILGDEVGGRLVVLAAGAALALLLVRLARRKGLRVAAAAEPAERRDLDLLAAGAGVFVGTYALGQNFNYRMVFLLLTLPQLLRWARARDAPLPFAAGGAAAVVATLWLGTSLPVLGVGDWWVEASASFPYDELLNVALFGYLGAALALVLTTAAGARR
jgi:Glycosyltransferase family 87